MLQFDSGGGSLSTFVLILSYCAVAAVAASVGVVVGGMLASAKVEDLYTRLDQADLANRANAQLLRELSEAMRLIVSEIAAGRASLASEDGYIRAQALLVRVKAAMEA